MTSRAVRVKNETVKRGSCVLSMETDGGVSAGIVGALWETGGVCYAVAEMWHFLQKGDGWSEWTTTQPDCRIICSASILSACIYAREGAVATVLTPARVCI